MLEEDSVLKMIDGSTSYMLSPEVPERIHNTYGDQKVREWTGF